MGFLYLLLTGIGFGGDLGFLISVPDDLGLLLWLTHCVELANCDGVAHVEPPGSFKSMMYVCGIDL